MNVHLKEIYGPWFKGWVLDKHSLSSTFLGNAESGRPMFDTKRTEVGEATYRLKYQFDRGQAAPLAEAIVEHIYPKFEGVGFIVPMPASKTRPWQPVNEVARLVAKLTQKPIFEDILRKRPGITSLKDLSSKQQKIDVIGDSIILNDEIKKQGRWNVLLIDDLYHTGASSETACKVLRTYPKVQNIYFAALTWRA